MYKHEWYTVLRWALIIAGFITIALLAGCATAVPYGMCNGDLQCEDKAIRREQRHFERDQLEIRQQSCAYPRWWDGRTLKCKTGDTWL